MKELTVAAVVQNLDTVTDFVNEQLDLMGCPMKIQMKIAVVIDEVFSNIAQYAYPNGGGDVTVCVESLAQPAGMSMTFIDKGLYYDPLQKEDPDITLGINERQVGGLGVFMIKKLMDDIRYEYKDEQNILTIRKYFE